MTDFNLDITYEGDLVTDYDFDIAKNGDLVTDYNLDITYQDGIVTEYFDFVGEGDLVWPVGSGSRTASSMSSSESAGTDGEDAEDKMADEQVTYNTLSYASYVYYMVILPTGAPLPNILISQLCLFAIGNDIRTASFGTPTRPRTL